MREVRHDTIPRTRDNKNGRLFHVLFGPGAESSQLPDLVGNSSMIADPTRYSNDKAVKMQ